MASTIDPGGSEPKSNTPFVRIAIEGCGHGTLNNIYDSVAKSSAHKGWDGVDVLIICGDFQATRNAKDLHAMAVPVKYRAMCDFHEYYSGKRAAPYLTIFVGGNHEASNYLFELYYGGWVAPNIYYMGAANVLQLGGLRIAGLSGIWKGFDYNKPHHERLPYSSDAVRSVYHVRELDTRKLLQIRTQVDIGLSHDWPQGIVKCGDWKRLFRYKPFLEEDANSGRLGSVAAKQVLERLRPRFWFSAHLHVRYEAYVKYKYEKDEATLAKETAAILAATKLPEIKPDDEESDTENKESLLLQEDVKNGKKAANSDEIELSLTDTEDEKPASPQENIENGASKPAGIQKTSEVIKPSSGPAESIKDNLSELRTQLPDSFKPQLHLGELPFPKDIQNESTKFLALDKCLYGRDFLQLLEIPSPNQKAKARSGPLQLEYDTEWLAITRVFAKDLVLGQANSRVPRNQGTRFYHESIQKEKIWVEEQIVAKGAMVVPNNFVWTAPPYNPSEGLHTKERPVEYLNPQTSQFCSLLQIANPFVMSEEERLRREAESVRISNEPPARGSRGGGGRYHSGRGRGDFNSGGGRGGFNSGQHRGAPNGGRGRGGFRPGRGQGRGQGLYTRSC